MKINIFFLIINLFAVLIGYLGYTRTFSNQQLLPITLVIILLNLWYVISLKRKNKEKSKPVKTASTKKGKLKYIVSAVIVVAVLIFGIVFYKNYYHDTLSIRFTALDLCRHTPKLLERLKTINHVQEARISSIEPRTTIFETSNETLERYGVDKQQLLLTLSFSPLINIIAEESNSKISYIFQLPSCHNFSLKNFEMEIFSERLQQRVQLKQLGTISTQLFREQELILNEGRAIRIELKISDPIYFYSVKNKVWDMMGRSMIRFSAFQFEPNSP